MADQINEVVNTDRVDGSQTIHRQEITTKDKDRTVSKIQSFIYTLFGLLQGLLAIRLILALLGANRTNAFADFIYDVTNPFVSMFQGLFNQDFVAGRSRFEVETVVAMAVYALLAWFIVKLIELIKKQPKV